MASPNPIFTDLAAVISLDGLVTEPDILEPYKSDWLVETADPQMPLAEAQPETTPQVPEIVQSCDQPAVWWPHKTGALVWLVGLSRKPDASSYYWKNVTHRNGQPHFSDKDRGGGRHAWVGGG